MGFYFKSGADSRQNLMKAAVIVAIFALLHAIVCYLLHDTSFGDGFILTCLTIGMVYSLIRFYTVPFDVFIGLAFLSCFAGFYIGTRGADALLRLVPHWGIWINVLTTTLVTIILGLIIIFLVRKSWVSNRNN